MCNGGDIQITENTVIIDMKKKRGLPAILTAMNRFQNTQVRWMRNKFMVNLIAGLIAYTYQDKKTFA